jgi:hypothetical protein
VRFSFLFVKFHLTIDVVYYIISIYTVHLKGYICPSVILIVPHHLLFQSMHVKLFLILVLHLRQFFIVRIFVKKATGAWGGSTFETSSLILKSYTRDPCNSPRWVLDSPFSVGTHQSFQILDLYNGGNHKNFQKCPLDSSNFTKILTIKNCRKCKTKIKKSFTKIFTIILSVKIVLTLRVKLPCRKCKILIVREIFEKFLNKIWQQKSIILPYKWVSDRC